MRLKYVLIAGAVIALAAATVAHAQSVFTVSATGSKKAGSAQKAKPFTGTFSYAVSGPGGSRPPAPDSFAWSWEGVKYNGKQFPTCSAQEIDQAQSDSICPGSSLIAEAPIIAKLGPENDPNTSAECLGKSFHVYNAGKNTTTWFIAGPGDQCAGVSYLPPFEGSIATKKSKVASASKKGSKKASTATLTLPLPDNITHPLPGIAGGVTQIDATFIQRKKKKKGKKIAYMESTGCKGQREFTFTTVDPEGTHVSTADAGSCK